MCLSSYVRILNILFWSVELKELQWWKVQVTFKLFLIELQETSSVLMSLTTESAKGDDDEDDDEASADGKDESTSASPVMTSPRYNITGGRISSVTDLSVLGEPDFDEKACETNVCRNGGTCLATLTGPKCHCPLQFSGRQCEEEVQVGRIWLKNVHF